MRFLTFPLLMATIMFSCSAPELTRPVPNLIGLQLFDTITLSTGESYVIVDIQDHRCPINISCTDFSRLTVYAFITANNQDTFRLRPSLPNFEVEDGVFRTPLGGEIILLDYEQDRTCCDGNIPADRFTLSFLVSP